MAMRPPILLLASLLLPVSPAFAQVTIDLHALDQLPNARPAVPRNSSPGRRAPNPAASSSVTASRSSAAGTASRSSAPVTASRPGPGSSGSAGQRDAAPTDVTVGSSAPDATLPVGVPPPPASLQASATSAPDPAPAAMTAAAIRVSFPATKADLGTDGTEAIHQLVQGAPTGENTTYNVVAYAAATPDDPSAARRLSLSRALAVRTTLMADGVPSTRIYVRALGSQAGDGPADRADVSVLGSNASSGKP